MPNFGSSYTANSMEPTYIYDLSDDDGLMSDATTIICDSPSEPTTDNLHDMSCYISDDVVSEESIIICDTPRRITRGAVHTRRTAATKRLRKQNRSKNNNIGSSANDPILISDEPIIENSSNRENVASTSETESESQRTSPAAQICPLCLETFENIRSKNIKFRATLCGHIFCEMCLSKCPTLNYKCPVCRKPVKPKQFIHLFL
ncbi:E3 ubiquitin-protein ligase RNF4 [Octopus vulgaris]|nr:E3 ubiquitin-protein ligase RNF4 [Octopus vulgaris]